MTKTVISSDGDAVVSEVEIATPPESVFQAGLVEALKNFVQK
ncbi:MAG: hypothetical protein WA416_15180 [Candidatus Sulfotelmatobacter sp.]